MAFYDLLGQSSHAAPPSRTKAPVVVPPAAKSPEKVSYPPPPPVQAKPVEKPQKKLVVVVVSASSGCPPCEQHKWMWDKIAQDGFTVQKVDIGPLATPDYAAMTQWKVSRVPTVIFTADGAEVCRWPKEGNDLLDFSPADIEAAVRSQQ